MSQKLFNDFVEKNNLDVQIIELDDSTHTAEDAAKANGVPVSNIVKSLLVRVEVDQEEDLTDNVGQQALADLHHDIFKLILVPGDKRLDFEEWMDILDAPSTSLPAGRQGSGQVKIRMATPDEVKKITGHSIGGVPPFGHLEKIETYIAKGFDEAQMLVAAAGSANSVFKISFEEMKRIIK